ncbi:MAG: MotA/TolQ/ExbB proton channel family protein [Bacteriovoracaceae bacterium]|nr:MotA/TolQ/ExbB proton channel family protein [Bacteriovoracaceae bacterium]
MSAVIQFLNSGGSITWMLLIINVIGVSMIGQKFWELFRINGHLSDKTNELVESFKVEVGNKQASEEMKLALLKDHVSRFTVDLEKGTNTLKIIATTGPLLGLLGTVIGILEAFMVISKTGMDDPSMFANGISYALITTVSGLVVAIPHLVAYNYAIGFIDAIGVKLEQSAVKKYFLG